MNKNSIAGLLPVNNLKRAFKIMKATFILLFFSILYLQASTGYAQETELTLDLKSTTIQKVFKEIENRSDFRFLFAGNTAEIMDKRIDLSVKAEHIDEILDRILSKTSLTYKILDNQIVVYRDATKITAPTDAATNSDAAQQKREIRGRITTADGETVIGANIVEMGTTNGTITDNDGNFSLQVEEAAKLHISYIGFLAQEIQTTGINFFEIVLHEDLQALDELVVVGYGTIRRSDLTGSVASISGEEIRKVPIMNTAEAIKGRLPGVNIVSTDGSPDADIIIRVRGGGSITQDNSPLYVVDGFIVSSIRDIPPSDITSINVLKDAAATAIYGAQAANGVIVITTKAPQEGKAQVSYNGFVQLKGLPNDRKYDLLDPYEFVMMHYERAKLTFSNADLSSFERYFGKYNDLELYHHIKGTDWQDEIFGKKQLSQSHNITLSGGTEKTKISLSLTNNNDEGIMVGNGYERNSLNFKLVQNISKSLNFDGNFRVTNTRIDGGGTSGNSQISIGRIVKARPVNGIADELDIDLSTIDTGDDYQSFLLNLISPVELAEQFWRRREDMNYVLQGGLTWNPIENMILKTAFTNSKSFEEFLTYYGPLTYESSQHGNSLPLGTTSNSVTDSYRWVNTLNYDFKDLGLHKLDFLLGHEIYSSGGKSTFARVENFRESIKPKEMFANMALGTFDIYSSSEATRQNRISFFGRANYQLMKKYMLTATIRSDASSKFAKDNRLGIFPAVALGWKLNEEEFLKDVENINELKLRASYGETGNDRISVNATKFLFTASSVGGPGMGTNNYNAYYTPEGNTLYNPNLVWETTINRNIGLDYTLYKGRIRGSLDLYQNTTKDLLLASAISPISGFSTQWNNIGSTSNKGLEVDLTTYIFDQEDFTLSFNMNFGMNRARIDELDGTNERFFQSNWASTDLSDRDDYYLSVGQSVGMIYGYLNDGMYTVDDFEGYDDNRRVYILKEGIPDNKNKIGVSSVRPGYMKLKDISGPNGKPDGIIDSYDRTVIGNALPDATGGFGLNASFKGFDASLFFNWSLGNDIYNTGKISYNSIYRSSYGNMLDMMSMEKRFTYIDVEGSYTGTAGEVVTDLEQLRIMNKDKIIWSGSNSFSYASAVVSDWAIEDGSFLRLSNFTLGYTVPRRIISRFGMSQLRVYAAGYNLWLLTNYTGYDPEVSTSRGSYAALTPGLDHSSYPKFRSFTLGLNVTF